MDVGEAPKDSLPASVRACRVSARLPVVIANLAAKPSQEARGLLAIDNNDSERYAGDKR